MSRYGEKNPWDSARDVHGSEMAVWRGSRRRIRPSKADTLQEARKRHLEKLGKDYAKQIDRSVRIFIRSMQRNGLTKVTSFEGVQSKPVNGSLRVRRRTTHRGHPLWIVNVSEFWPKTNRCNGMHTFEISGNGIWLFRCTGPIVEQHQTSPRCMWGYGYGTEATWKSFEFRSSLILSDFDLVSRGVVVEVAHKAMAMILGVYGIQLPPR